MPCHGGARILLTSAATRGFTERHHGAHSASGAGGRQRRRVEEFVLNKTGRAGLF
jgi:hypothetical protein